MVKKFILTHFLLMLPIMGCNESKHVNENVPINGHSTMSTEMKPEPNNNNYLLTVEEARQALSRPTDVDIPIPKRIQAMNEETQKIRKMGEEHDKKVKEIRETMEDKNEAERVVLQMVEDLENRIWEVYESADYGLDSISTDDANNRFEKYGFEFDNSFMNRPDFIQSYLNWKEEDVVHIEGWRCNLKEGLFVSSYDDGISASTTRGRFKKDKNGKWVATIVFWSHGSRMP